MRDWISASLLLVALATGFTTALAWLFYLAGNWPEVTLRIGLWGVPVTAVVGLLSIRLRPSLDALHNAGMND